jgi:hypothetical protein
MRRAVEPPAEARFEADPKQTPAALDTSLNDIAQRLDAALRRPGTVTPRPAGAPSASEAASRPTPPSPPAAPPAPSTGAPPEPKTEPPAPDAPRAASPSPAQGMPAATATKSAAPSSPSPPAAAKPEKPEERKRPGKTVYDSLEEEMASLLGRPTDKNQ